WSSARILPADVPDGPAARPGARSISRVVTHPEARGQGWGRRLLADIVERFSDQPLTLHAQSRLEGLFTAFGFAANGPRLLQDGTGCTARPGAERPGGLPPQLPPGRRLGAPLSSPQPRRRRRRWR